MLCWFERHFPAITRWLYFGWHMRRWPVYGVRYVCIPRCHPITEDDIEIARRAGVLSDDTAKTCVALLESMQRMKSDD